MTTVLHTRKKRSHDMAIDTFAKRRAASGIQITRIPAIFPDALAGPRWRAESGWGYFFDTGLPQQDTSALDLRRRRVDEQFLLPRRPAIAQDRRGCD